MKAHVTILDPDDGRHVLIHPASEDAVKTVLDAPTTGDDGRSEWVWVRLPNGDLVLGVFPQGDTYFSVEDDAHYRGPFEDMLWCETCGERHPLILQGPPTLAAPTGPTEGQMASQAMKIKTNRHWREFLYRDQVPDKILSEQFDWLDEDTIDGFIKYRGEYYHLQDFIITDVSDGWAYHGDSYYSALLIRVSEDGERYQIARAYW